MPELPRLLGPEEIAGRLAQIFPDGVPNRNYVVRDMAARTVFVFLYLGATEGAGPFLKPDQVVRMNDAQARKTSDEERMRWREDSVRPGGAAGWYAKNTREPIRDETLRQGFVPLGAAIERRDLPTTSPRGRYALEAEFAALFDPDLQGTALSDAIHTWQRTHLNPAALARVELVRRATFDTDEGVLVTFPNGETRRLAAGPSSAIMKAVVETFAPRFLSNPGVVFVSESRNQVPYKDERLLHRLGLDLPADRLLPDAILVDLDDAMGDATFVFVEVVASDGPITAERKAALARLVADAGFDARKTHYVTAYSDRDHPAFKKTVSVLAWGSWAWFVSEPEMLLVLHEGGGDPTRIREP